MKRTVWIQHHPGEPDSATAREGNVLTEQWWKDGFARGGTVTEIVYDDEKLTSQVFRHYQADGSVVDVPAGEHRVFGWVQEDMPA